MEEIKYSTDQLKSAEHWMSTGHERVPIKTEEKEVTIEKKEEDKKQ